MKKYELLPTEENLIDTLCRNTINRNKDIVYLYRILQAQEGASAIAIDGRWGSGKTFFVRQTQMVINALNPSSDMDDELKNKIISGVIFSQNDIEKENYCISVYYDAWENDNDTDPIFSLVYEISKQVSEEFSLSDISFIKLAGAIVEAISGHNVNGIKNTLSSEDPFTKFKTQKEIYIKLKEFITRLLNERGNRLIIFVDELDRCNPGYAVKLLEQIKHYVFDERITFVFSVNLDQLQHTIKNVYGNQFDACRYLDRFFDLRIDIPPANIDKYFDDIGLQSSYLTRNVLNRVIRMFNFQLREISKFYSQVKAAVYNQKLNRDINEFSFPEEKGRGYIMTNIVPLLIGLRIADISQYDDFINGRNIEPLRQLYDSGDENYSILKMLNQNESLREKEGTVLVTKEEVIDKVYNAIFVNQYTGINRSIILGEYEFSKESKSFAIYSSNMMSKYADLS